MQFIFIISVARVVEDVSMARTENLVNSGTLFRCFLVASEFPIGPHYPDPAAWTLMEGWGHFIVTSFRPLSLIPPHSLHKSCSAPAGHGPALHAPDDTPC